MDDAAIYRPPAEGAPYRVFILNAFDNNSKVSKAINRGNCNGEDEYRYKNAAE